MPSARYIKLKKKEDKKLKELEHNQGMNDKVRLRAKVLRLSHRGMSVEEIAEYTGRHSTTILRDFDRFEEAGMKGLADGKSRGQPSPIGQKERRFLVAKLSEERGWTASQLADVLNEAFELAVNRETMRVCLHELGYSWQRHRYVPAKEPDAEVLALKQEEFDTLKKEPKRARLS